MCRAHHLNQWAWLQLSKPFMQCHFCIGVWLHRLVHGHIMQTSCSMTYSHFCQAVLQTGMLFHPQLHLVLNLTWAILAILEKQLVTLLIPCDLVDFNLDSHVNLCPHRDWTTLLPLPCLHSTKTWWKMWKVSSVWHRIQGVRTSRQNCLVVVIWYTSVGGCQYSV